MNEIDLTNRDACPRCGNIKLKNWHQLNDEEKEIVKRLPASAAFTLEDRIALHQWCTRCWFESKDKETHNA